MKRVLGAVALTAYIGSIVLANWLISRFGAVPVGFGLLAPAGVYAAGAAFTLRDVTQDTLGQGAVLVAIVVGAAVSALVASTATIAFASAAAFLVSELLDFGVYTPLRERNWPFAVVASNAADVVRRLGGLRLHGFGLKVSGLLEVGHLLASADSMAWSLDGRWVAAHGGAGACGCRWPQNCPTCALSWRERLLAGAVGIDRQMQLGDEALG